MSPAIKFDVSDLDPDESTAAPEPPPPGLYKAKIVECKAGFKAGENGKPDKNAPRIEVTYQCLESADNKNQDYKGGGRVWDYVTFYETTKRRLDQFLQAVGAASKTKRAGQVDPEKCVGKIVKLRVVGKKGEDDYRPNVSAVWKWDGGGGAEEDDGLGDTTPAKKAGGAKKAAKVAKAVKKAAPKKVEPDYDELGGEADNGDEDAVTKLTELAEEAGVDPDEYATWSELASVLAGGDGQSEEEAPSGPTLEELGEAADGGDDEAGGRLTELAEANDIDPEQYGTWAEVATLLEEAGVDPNEEGTDPF